MVGMNQGGVIKCQCISMTIQYSQFYLIQGTSIYYSLYNFTQNSVGSCFQDTSIKQAVIQDSTFQNGTAQDGGGIYIDGSNLVKIQGNEFQNQSVLRSGGALYIQCLMPLSTKQGNCILIISGNMFLNNSAGIQGGAIFLGSYGKQLQLKLNQFFLNTSPSGSMVATFPFSYNLKITEIQQLDRRLLQTTTLPSLISPGSYIQVYIELLDYLGQVVLSEVNSIAVIYSDISSLYFKNNSAIANNGTYNFDLLQIGAQENTKVQLEIYFIGVTTYRNNLTFINEPIAINLTVGTCAYGETLSSNGTCSKCTSDEYYVSFADGTKECAQCPTGGNCSLYYSVLPRQGYQRSLNNAMVFIACPFNDSCLAGDENNQDGSCKVGYEGFTCFKCSQGYYMSMSGIQPCQKCSSFGVLIFQMILFIIVCLSLVLILKRIGFKINSYSMSLYSGYLLGLIGYLQLVFIFSTFDQQLPITSNNLSKYLWDKLVLDFAFIDCLLQHSSLSTLIPNVYTKVVLFLTLPYLIPILTLIILTVIQRQFRKQQLIQQTAQLTICSLILLYPCVIVTVFQLTNCLTIDGTSLLRFDITQQCYKNSHIKVTLTTILLLLINHLGWLILAYFKIKKTQANKILGLNSNKQIQNTLGFIITLFKSKLPYWELIIISRMTLLSLFITVLQTYSIELQLLVAFFILTNSIFIQIRCKPYVISQFNRLELTSLISHLVNIYTLFYLQTTTYPTSIDLPQLDIFLVIIMYISRIIYPLYWVYLFRLDLLKEIFKIQKFKLVAFLSCGTFHPQQFFRRYLQTDRNFQKYQNKNRFEVMFADQGFFDQNLNRQELLKIIDDNKIVFEQTEADPALRDVAEIGGIRGEVQFPQMKMLRKVNKERRKKMLEIIGKKND